MARNSTAHKSSATIAAKGRRQTTKKQTPANGARKTSAAKNRTRRRGRPPGSITLTKDIQATIVDCIRAGAFDHVAAETAGVAPRTFRDWMARGEGRSTDKACTPQLRRFAEAVNRARAEARLAAEIRVYREDPKYWLSKVARTKPDREGWTDPKLDLAGSHGEEPVASEDLDAELARMLLDLLASGDIVVPRCSHPRCRCPFHRTRRSEVAA
jgi:hypothetical protein